MAISIAIGLDVGARRADDVVLRRPAAGRHDRARGERVLRRRERRARDPPAGLTAALRSAGARSARPALPRPRARDRRLPGRVRRRPGALRLRPLDDPAAPRGMPARARPRADRRSPPAPLAHPLRPRGRGGDDRAAASRAHGVGLRGRRAAPDRPVAARVVGTAPLRRRLRPLLGRARARAGARSSGSPPATRSGGRRSRRRATPRTTSATCATACCSPATRAASASSRSATSSRPHRRPTSTSRPGTPRSTRSRAASRSALALIHFGVETDVPDHLTRLHEELDRWAGWVRDGVGQDEFVARARRACSPRRSRPRRDRRPRAVVARAAPLLGQARATGRRRPVVGAGGTFASPSASVRFRARSSRSGMSTTLGSG